MEGYILTEGGYILTRMIIMSFPIIHCFVGYFNSVFQFYVPPKLYHGFFLTEFVALTAFITWCCVCEPFVDGVFLAVVGYFFVYLCWFACYMLSRHVMISHTKVYEMIPYAQVHFENQDGISGFIKAGSWTQEVVVFDKEFFETASSQKPVMVKFKRYPNIPRVFEAVMELVDEQTETNV